MPSQTVYQALERFAQRIAETADPRDHQQAGRELQSVLRRLAAHRQAATPTETDAPK